MARRRSSRSTKIQPAVQTMWFNTPSVSAGAVGFFHIDLSQCASLMNRRFYRQGLNWAVSSIKVKSLATGTVGVAKLPNTWVMSNAWEKGFRAWQKMNDDALEGSPSVKPKFLDFKIYADSTHHRDGFDANLLPRDGLGNLYTAGTWDSSKLRVPDSFMNTADREIVAVGGNYPGISPITGLDAVSLIDGYAASRLLPNILDPNAPSDADDANGVTPENWISALSNEGIEQTSEVIEDMISENTIAPYPFENDGLHSDTMYPGGANQAPALEFHDSDTLTTTTIGGMSRLKGGNFPCGLMQILWSPTSTSSNVSIQIELVPGTHRGYLCEPMTEM